VAKGARGQWTWGHGMMIQVERSADGVNGKGQSSEKARNRRYGQGWTNL
jgi:hypothetical protein